MKFCINELRINGNFKLIFLAMSFGMIKNMSTGSLASVPEYEENDFESICPLGSGFFSQGKFNHSPKKTLRNFKFGLQNFNRVES